MVLQPLFPTEWCLTVNRKPLGNPNPAVANLALAVVLLVVISLQAGFNAWQGEYPRTTFNNVINTHQIFRRGESWPQYLACCQRTVL